MEQWAKAEQQALEATYWGKLSAYRFEDKTTPWGETQQEKVQYLSGVKCALSQQSLTVAADNDSHFKNDYQAKLFLPPDIDLPVGSEVVVVQDGMTYRFRHTGESFRYSSHQEIMIRRLEDA